MKIGYGRALVLISALVAGGAFADTDAPTRTASGESLSPSGAPGSITDTSVHNRGNAFVVMLELPYSYLGLGVGVELKYSIMILPDGFIPAVNDSVAIEPAINVQYGFGYSYYNYVGLAAHADFVWTFHFTDRFAVYGLFGLGVGFAIYTYDTTYYNNGPTGLGAYPYIDPAVGIKFRLGDTVTLRAEIGRALRVGLQF